MRSTCIPCPHLPPTFSSLCGLSSFGEIVPIDRDIFVSLVFLVFALAFSNSLWFTYSSLLATEVLIGAALPVLAVLRSR